jgi:hypothetical protein
MSLAEVFRGLHDHEQSDPNAFAPVWTMTQDGSDQIGTKVPCSGVVWAPRWQLM